MYCPNYRAGLSHKTDSEGYNPFDDKMRYAIFGGLITWLENENTVNSKRARRWKQRTAAICKCRNRSITGLQLVALEAKLHK